MIKVDHGKWQNLGPHFSTEVMRLIDGMAVRLETERGIGVDHNMS